ncbi:hypothetical protein J4E05_20745 [Thalassospira sp. NFXS8]|uniref:hypothetical protein n=1 Tax=Thalassospira sp. NFXS8 TaxID=2819093 RepID=UPI0032E01665
MKQYPHNKISYFLLSKSHKTSTFNEYESRTIDNREIIKSICALPKNFAEIHSDVEHVILHRIIGFHDGYEISFLNDIEDLHKKHQKIKILINDTITNQIAEKNSTSHKNAIYIGNSLTTDLDSLTINRSTFTINEVYDCIEKLISRLSKKDIAYYTELKKITTIKPGKRNTDTKESNIETHPNLFTEPNITLLKSIKIESKKLNHKNIDDKKQIESQVNAIDNIKNYLLQQMKPNALLPDIHYVISDLSSNTGFSFNKSRYNKNSLGSDHNHDRKEIELAIRTANQGKNIEDNCLNPYINELKIERETLTSLISIYCSSKVAPNINTKLSNNDICFKLKNLGDIYRGENRKKINKTMESIQGILNHHMAVALPHIKQRTEKNLKIISNLPIEWAEHDNLPLMIRHNVSRIPVTPGNITTLLQLSQDQIYLTIRSFKKILFISSFPDDDPIKDHAKEKVNKVIDLLKNASPETDIEIIWKTPANKDELIKCIKENKVAITIFDLHGAHDENGGRILLKDESIPAFDLGNYAAVSPIVILSSCDTNPIDRDHQTTTNAFFLAGARTVLSSALPLLSHEASSFIARLLIRIQLYLPKRVEEYKMPIRWSNVVTGMIRRTYYSELTDLLEKKNKISNQEKHALNFSIYNYLDPLSENWPDLILKEISMKTKISKNDLSIFIKKEFRLPDCLKYMQMGNPDQIIIIPEYYDIIDNSHSDLQI